MKDFIKIRKVRNLQLIIFSCLLLIMFSFFLFHSLTGQVLNVARAYEVIRFGQTILPADPVETASELSKEKKSNLNLSNSDYRFILLQNCQMKII